MKFFIDIGHPAHVHYFKFLINKLEKKGHHVFVSARDKDVTIELLNDCNIRYYNRGKGKNTLIGKIIYLLKTNLILFKKAKEFCPDLFISFASPYAAQVSFMMNKHHIAFTDTEHAKLGIASFLPFSNVVLTPNVYDRDLGKKHIRFNGFMEQCYMNEKISSKPIINPKYIIHDKSVLIRLVSWNASHDIGQSGFLIKDLESLINSIKDSVNIFISCEGNIPKKFIKYELPIQPNSIHNLLKFVDLFIGEGATMASECAMIGTPAIYVNSLTAGTIKEQEKFGLIYRFSSSKGVLPKALDILKQKDIKTKYRLRSGEMIKKQINLKKFIYWFITNYPESFKILKKDPSFQFNIS